MLWAALLLLVIIIAASLLRAHRVSSSDHEPSCGRCGYIVRGIPTLTCPECGSDLREVGITTGSTGHGQWIPFFFGALVWSLVLHFAASLTVLAIDAVLPRRGAAVHLVTLLLPKSGTFQSVTINASGDYRTGAAAAADPYEPVVSAELLLNDGGIATLRADSRRDHYAYRAPAGLEVSASGEPDAAVILAWMKHCGIDTSSPDVLREASQIVQEMRSPPPNRTSSGYESSGSSSPYGAFASGTMNWSADAYAWWPNAILWTLALLAWLAGLRWLARRFGVLATPGRS